MSRVFADVIVDISMSELDRTFSYAVPESMGLPVYQPAKVRTPEAVAKIREMEPDLIAVAAFGQIIPKEILDMPKYGCLNVHACREAVSPPGSDGGDG